MRAEVQLDLPGSIVVTVAAESLGARALSARVRLKRRPTGASLAASFDRNQGVKVQQRCNDCDFKCAGWVNACHVALVRAFSRAAMEAGQGD